MPGKNPINPINPINLINLINPINLTASSIVRQRRTKEDQPYQPLPCMAWFRLLSFIFFLLSFIFFLLSSYIYLNYYLSTTMPVFTRHTKKIIIKIDDFFDIVEEGLLIFKEGISSYLNGDMETFASHLHRIDELESRADKLQKSIENDMIIHTILPQYRSEVATLLEGIDDLIDTCKEVMKQFDVEIPNIPGELHRDFISLTAVVTNSCEELIPAARSFFKQPQIVRNQLNRVYFYEREGDNLSNKIKRHIFHHMKDLTLAEKSHLRYFTHHVERISDSAESVADLLSSMAMRVVM